MVDASFDIPKRTEPNLPSLQDDNRLRCFSSGMSSHLGRNINRVSLVSSGAKPTYQLLGPSGSYTGSSNLCQGEVRHFNPVEFSQQSQQSRRGLQEELCLPRYLAPKGNTTGYYRSKQTHSTHHRE